MTLELLPCKLCHGCHFSFWIFVLLYWNAVVHRTFQWRDQHQSHSQVIYLSEAYKVPVFSAAVWQKIEREQIYFYYLRQGGYVFARVCLSVCLIAG